MFNKQSIFLIVTVIFNLNNNINAQHVCANSKINSSVLSLNKTNANSAQMDFMEKYDVIFHDLNLNVERTSTYIAGSVKTIAKSKISDLYPFDSPKCRGRSPR